MNNEFHGTTTCIPKKLAKQLFIELGKSISHQQRQALLDIYQALDRTESAHNQSQQNRTVHSAHDITEDRRSAWIKRTQCNTAQHFVHRHSV